MNYIYTQGHTANQGESRSQHIKHLLQGYAQGICFCPSGHFLLLSKGDFTLILGKLLFNSFFKQVFEPWVLEGSHIFYFICQVFAVRKGILDTVVMSFKWFPRISILVWWSYTVLLLSLGHFIVGNMDSWGGKMGGDSWIKWVTFSHIDIFSINVERVTLTSWMKNYLLWKRSSVYF